MTQCANCKAEVDAAALTSAGAKGAVLAVLKDWRMWALAFAVTVAFGMIGGIFGIRAMGAGSGAVIGVIVGVRMQKMRTCPACKRVAYFRAAPPI